jgi:hypothetical protein
VPVDIFVQVVTISQAESNQLQSAENLGVPSTISFFSQRNQQAPPELPVCSAA